MQIAAGIKKKNGFRLENKYLINMKILPHVFQMFPFDDVIMVIHN